MTDNDGNVTSRTCSGQTVTFTWTAESRLASYTVGGQTIAFQYDAAGWLVRKDLNGAPQSYFLWDGDNLLAELTSTGTGLAAEYSYYGPDQLHALFVGGTEYNAHADGLGNVIALTDGTQAVNRTYGYTAWGQSAGGSDLRPFTNADRARFKGALWLGPEVELYYMRARWYEPQSGRFLSEDPIGLAGGINPFMYAADDPVNERDPSGRDLDPIVVEAPPYDWGEVLRLLISSGWGGGGGGSGLGGFGVGGGGGGGGGGNAGQQRNANQPGPRPRGPWCDDVVFTGLSLTLAIVGGGTVGGGFYFTRDGEVGLYFRGGGAWGLDASFGVEVGRSSRTAFPGPSSGGCLGVWVFDYCSGSNPGGTTRSAGVSGGLPIGATYQKTSTGQVKLLSGKRC